MKTASTNPLTFAKVAKPPSKIRLRLGLQGGGALGAYAGGFLQIVGDDPQIDIIEGSALSAGAANMFVWKHAGADGLEAFWKQIGSAGDQATTALHVDDLTSVRRIAQRMDNVSFFPGQFGFMQMMASQAIAVQETYKSYLMSGFKAAGAPTPLAYLRSTLTESIKKNQLPTPHRTNLHVTTVTKNDPSGDLSLENVIEQIHSGDKVGVDHVIASAALHLLTEEERSKAFLIDGVPHWDGVYSGKNPNMDVFSTRSKAPIAIISVDEPTVRRSLTDEHIIYGGIHQDVSELEAKHKAPVYHSNLEHRSNWDPRIRTQPGSKIIQELMAIGREDAYAFLDQIKRDHGLAPQTSVQPGHDRIAALG